MVITRFQFLLSAHEQKALEELSVTDDFACHPLGWLLRRLKVQAAKGRWIELTDSDMEQALHDTILTYAVMPSKTDD